MAGWRPLAKMENYFCFGPSFDPLMLARIAGIPIHKQLFVGAGEILCTDLVLLRYVGLFQKCSFVLVRHL